MKNNLKRKELQEKLINHISGFASTLAKADSKKLKKSVRKASKLIAKAILKNTDEAEVKVSLNDSISKKAKPAEKKPSNKKKPTHITRKRRKPPTKKIAVKPIENAKAVPNSNGAAATSTENKSEKKPVVK